MQPDYDLIIAGGGLVGSALAVALRDSGLRLALVDSRAGVDVAPHPVDARPIALSYGSAHYLRRLQVWDALHGNTQPIRRIVISQLGGFGKTRLAAAERGVDAFGYVTRAHQIQSALETMMPADDTLDRCRDTTVIDFQPRDTVITVSLNCRGVKRTTSARLLVAADGGVSALRTAARIDVEEKDYQQCAICAELVVSAGDGETAYERFTDTGPLALLPIAANRYALVWVKPTGLAHHLAEQSDREFIRRLHDEFGYCLGRMRLDSRCERFPLRLFMAEGIVAPRLALLGNAAHQLHPVAGQGYNLGLRDVEVFAERIVEAGLASEDLGAPGFLSRFERMRQADQRAVKNFTDGLVGLFALAGPIASGGRGCGLLALEMLTPGKWYLADFAMGIGRT